MGKISENYKTIIRSEFGLLGITLYNSQKGDSCLIVNPSENIKYEVPIIRIHSSCLFGEVFHSQLCECQHQLHASLKLISEEGGVLIYLFQEGRGVGIANKIRAMEIERLERVGTEEAFRLLGFASDLRNYDLAIEAMRFCKLPTTIRLITNNPNKISALEKAGFLVSERVEPMLNITLTLAQAMHRKQSSLGHILYSNFTTERDSK